MYLYQEQLKLRGKLKAVFHFTTIGANQLKCSWGSRGQYVKSDGSISQHLFQKWPLGENVPSMNVNKAEMLTPSPPMSTDGLIRTQLAKGEFF